MSTDTEITCLEEEIVVKQRHLEALRNKSKVEAKSKVVRLLDSYTVTEKCKHFDAFYASAMNTLNQVVEDGFHNEDDAQYGWEGIMSLLEQPDDGGSTAFWGYFNSFIK